MVKGRTKGTNKEGEQLKKKIATKKHSRKKSFLLSFNKRICVQRLKRLPAMWETWVRSLGQEDPLEKEMATHSCILAWRIPWVEKPGGVQSTGLQRVRHDWMTSLSLSFTFSFFTCKCLSAEDLSWQYPSIVTLGGSFLQAYHFSNGSPTALGVSGEGISGSWRLDHLPRHPSLLPWLWVVVDICLCGSHISGSQTWLNIRITCERFLQIYSWAVLPRGSNILVRGGI